MALRRDAARYRMLIRYCKRSRRLHRGRGRVGMRQYIARHAICERRLADAGRTADQPGVRQPAAAIGSEQRARGLGVPEQNRGRPRCRGLRLGVGGVGGAHEAALSNVTGAVAGSRRWETIFQIVVATCARGWVVSISTQRSLSVAASRR